MVCLLKEIVMSHPDPLFDSDNTLEDDMVYNDDEQFYMEREFTGNFDRNYDDHDDFYSDDSDPDGDGDYDPDYDIWDDDESMDGDHDSAMTSCGWGTDEDYGHFGEWDDDGELGDRD